MTNKTSSIVDNHEYKRNFKKAIGRILIEERVSRNLRIETLSAQLNIPIKLIEKVELGQSDFSWLTLHKILEFYHKKLNIILAENN